MIVVAGVNNINKRGNHNAFLEVKSKRGKLLSPENLNAYADIDFGRKMEFIDNSWFKFNADATSNYIRNSIAHYKAEYTEISQLVTYFPRKEGLAQDIKEEMTFLEFLRRILLIYREMHRLHHGIKCLFYYRFLIQKKGIDG